MKRIVLSISLYLIIIDSFIDVNDAIITNEVAAIIY